MHLVERKCASGIHAGDPSKPCRRIPFPRKNRGGSSLLHKNSIGRHSRSLRNSSLPGGPLQDGAWMNYSNHLGVCQPLISRDGSPASGSSTELSSVPTLVEQKELVIESEAIFTHRDLVK